MRHRMTRPIAFGRFLRSIAISWRSSFDAQNQQCQPKAAGMGSRWTVSRMYSVIRGMVLRRFQANDRCCYHPSMWSGSGISVPTAGPHRPFILPQNHGDSSLQIVLMAPKGGHRICGRSIARPVRIRFRSLQTEDEISPRFCTGALAKILCAVPLGQLLAPYTYRLFSSNNRNDRQTGG